MNYLQLPGICLLVILSCATSFAQNKAPVNQPDLNKPKLFADFPDKIPVDINSLRSLINTETGKMVSLWLGPDARKSFNGEVVSRADDNIIHSVVIRSGNFNGATLTLSSSTQPDGTVKFTGRIISFGHGDLYELRYQNEQYILIKKNFYDLINE